MKNKHSEIPQLRFHSFQQSWQLKKNSELLNRISNPVKVEPEKLYTQIGIRSHGKGVFHKEPVTGKDLGNKRVFWVKENCLVLNIVFAWEQAVAKTTENEKGMIASHRFPMYQAISKQCDVDYLLLFYLTPKGKSLLELASPGGAGRNKTLGQKEFENIKFLIPEKAEQQKIASFFTSIDQKINCLKEKKEKLELYKKGIRQQIFSQQLIFKTKDGKKFPSWKKFFLGDCLEYEQPTKYLVRDTDYNDSYLIPVVTAGKSFILGYTHETDGVFNEGLPVIIFDDFTTASQFVDFPFKGKSTAMKILKAKSGNNIKFMFEAMQMINYEVGGHGRHWISIFAGLEIRMPSIEEQTKIANFLSAINEKINAVQLQIEKTTQWKKGLLQKMFC